MSPSRDPVTGPDDYRKFRFRVKYNGRYVAGFPVVYPLPQKLKGSAHHASGYPAPSIGPEGQRTPFFINPEQGITCDLSFEQWISMVRCYGPATGKGSLLVEYKRPLTIEECDENGDAVYEYRLTNCRVSEYRAVHGPGACENEIAIGHMRLGFDSWVRRLPED